MSCELNEKVQSIVNNLRTGKSKRLSVRDNAEIKKMIDIKYKKIKEV